MTRSSSTLAALLIGACAPAHATSCAMTEDMLRDAETIFSAYAHRISLQPEGVEIPSVAIVSVPIDQYDLEVLAQQQGKPLDPNTEISANWSSGSSGGQWTGTVGELPAHVIEPWLEFEVRVLEVWRGAPRPNELIYVAGHQYPEIGQKFLIAFRPSDEDRLMFRGPCQVLHVGEDLEKFAAHLGEPLYTYEHSAP